MNDYFFISALAQTEILNRGAMLTSINMFSNNLIICPLTLPLLPITFINMQTPEQ